MSKDCSTLYEFTVDCSLTLNSGESVGQGLFRGFRADFAKGLWLPIQWIKVHDFFATHLSPVMVRLHKFSQRAIYHYLLWHGKLWIISSDWEFRGTWCNWNNKYRTDRENARSCQAHPTIISSRCKKTPRNILVETIHVGVGVAPLVLSDVSCYEYSMRLLPVWHNSYFEGVPWKYSFLADIITTSC